MGTPFVVVPTFHELSNLPEFTESVWRAQPSARILLIDDNESIHQDFRKILNPVMPGKAALADVSQMVDIIDDRQRSWSKSVPLLLKTQGLLAHLLLQSGHGAAGFITGVAQHFQLGGNGFHFAHGP